MLVITVPGVDYFDEAQSRFIELDGATLQLEHSLVSLSKWEAEFKRPFLNASEKTDEEAIGYIRAMTLTEGVSPEVYKRLSNDHLREINAYIEDTNTATFFRERPGQPKSREIVTAELIYYWMFGLSIPLDCQNWHLNRLFTMIKVASEKNSPPKKMGKQELANHHRQLNEARKKQYGTKG